ncbi:hypothetical protein EU545_03200 [Candidatus Thorarchaeota archaeon]|nr:MAG: hypothetical protein EU545_03200 [Candidatus Thorarchaeota archaeon]
MRKQIAGILLVVVIVAAASPILLYGTQVQVANLEMGISVGSGGTASVTDGYQVLQIPSFIVGIERADLSVRNISAYEYAMTRVTGITSSSGEGDSEGALVDIAITLSLRTPSNNTVEISIEPGVQGGTGTKNVEVLLGPEEGIVGEGTFTLIITISIVITPPGFSSPVVDKTLTPVNRTFDVGQP